MTKTAEEMIDDIELALDQALESAWNIIANAYNGNWEQAPEDWRQAAERWRNGYFEYLNSRFLSEET